MEILLIFDSTTDAIAAEQHLLAAGVEVRVMSLPSTIRAGCGIVLRVAPEALRGALSVLDGYGLARPALYTRATDGPASRYEPI